MPISAHALCHPPHVPSTVGYWAQPHPLLFHTPQVANWQAFQLRGDVPAARKAAAAAAVGTRVVMFGGSLLDAADSAITTDDLVVMDMGEH